jgi:hypothetical protein
VEYDDVVKRLGPCGLDCYRCAEYERGEIKKVSIHLLELLGNYERVAVMKSQVKPCFYSFPQFKEILSFFAQASCGGCREDTVECPIPDICIAKDCTKEKSVDFCFQCSEYPCERQFHGGLTNRWKERNNRMKEIGVIQFYEEQKRLPRY